MDLMPPFLRKATQAPAPQSAVPPVSLEPTPDMQQGEVAPQMITDEQRQELLGLTEKVRGNLANLNTAQFSLQNKKAVTDSETLKEVFIIMKRAGVDLTNPDSVNQFFDSLRQKNPEMAQTFEQILEQLLGEETGENMESEMDMNNNMNNNNETIQENLRGSIPQAPQGTALG